MEPTYPRVLDESRVGHYPASAKAGGGYVWDAVLEYRVWCCAPGDAGDQANGAGYFCAFATAEAALAFYRKTDGAEEPLALIMQDEYLDEPTPGKYVHVKERRTAEWPLGFLSRPRRTASTIPDFLSPDAPPNRLEILLGLHRV